MDKKTYKKYAESHAPKSPIFKNSVMAFLFGGTICSLGELLKDVYMNYFPEKTSYCLVSVSLIFVAVLLTAVGVFDRIAKIAGAGTLVPITGFANAVASSAIDTKGEGFVLGVGVKIFTIAGPVILYGTVAGVVYGIIFYFVR